MKKLILTLAAIATTSFSFAQTADEVIDKYYTAIGGKDKWLKLISTIETAEISMQGTTINVKTYREHNKALKLEISLQGQTGYQLLTNKEGWNYMPFGGQMLKAEPSTKEQVEKGQEGLDVQGDLLNYKEKGHAVEYLGKEDLDGTECYKLSVKTKKGSASNYYFDASNYYLIKVSSKMEVDGKEVENVSEFSNYQKTPEGYVFAMAYSGGGAPGPVKVTKMEVNTKIDPKVFEPTNK
jgi:hypothetical protein